jgi:23S rRNA (uracil1939-C5)-methyltransferase
VGKEKDRLKEKPLSLGDIIELEIVGISHQGWGIGRYSGFTVFVPGSLAGERVKVKIRQVKKSFAVAELIRVITSSPYRVKPRCSISASCGGCHIQHAQYEHQLLIKRKIVTDALVKIGKLNDVQVHPVLGMTHPWKYRNRIQLHVKVEGDRINIGFFQPGTHELALFEECFLVPDIFNQVRNFLQEELGKYLGKADISLLKHVVLKISAYTGEITVVFVTVNNSVSFLGELTSSLIKKFPDVTSVVQNIQGKNTGALFGPEWKLILGKERIEDRIWDTIFSISPGSFVQVNPEQTQVLYRQVLEYAELTGKEIVMDIYCGIGTMSLLFARQVKKVIGIEEFPGAVEDAERNAHLNNINNVEFIAGKAEIVLPDMDAFGIHPDVIVVDPPRKGCDPAVLEAIAKMNPPKVIYVSCDPATLARDLKILTGKGYKVIEVQPVDMFPQTAHVESVVLITKL